HTQHQPALAGFGVSDREFIHGAVSDREFIHGAVSDREFIHGAAEESSNPGACPPGKELL
ncbi:MAG: hypothetical protein WAV74_22095, partial [Anaerolineae bacterium]